jgi:uncharacterized protein YutE (UPF0331/DUF86 family)
MVKPETVDSILNNLRSSQDKLNFLAKYDFEEFAPDFTKVESAKHLLQVSVECCLDLAHHIIADAGMRTPADYYDSFVVLNETGILPDEFMPTLRRMVSFRNRVVHLYWDVDESVVYDILHNHLSDFDTFVQYILDYLST